MSEGRVERRLAAIMAADIVGYSRLMGQDEAGTLARLKTLRRDLIDPRVAEHKGRIVKTSGDGILIEFNSVVGAVACAITVQTEMAERNASIPQDQRIEFRLGINLGDVIIDEDDIHGDGVNVAARLEGLAEPGGICVSGVVNDQVQGRLEVELEDTGEQSLKNITRPVRVYRARLGKAADAVPAMALPEKPSIAVLPFQNMSGDADQEFFADGIAEDVITLLSKYHGLFVIARNSTFIYKGQAVDIKRVGWELRVRYVLEGSVRKAGNRVRVTVQLIEAATGGHLWAERYDRDLHDIFAVQDEITACVSGAILPAVERSERERAARKPPDRLDAWETYHRGMWHLSKVNGEDNQIARTLFQRSLQLDPGLAAAMGGLALGHIHEAWLYGSNENRAAIVALANDCARRCLALDPTDPLGNVTSAVSLQMLGRHQEAVIAAERAVSLNPNHALSVAALGTVRAFSGQPAEAIEPLETALRLSPFDPFDYLWRHWISRAYYWSRNYEAAVPTARSVWRSHPQVSSPVRTLIAALGQLGRFEEAQEAIAEAVERFGREPFQALLLQKPGEDRDEGYEHLLDGLRKAGAID
jgi:adenylate cyclase